LEALLFVRSNRFFVVLIVLPVVGFVRFYVVLSVLLFVRRNRFYVVLIVLLFVRRNRLFVVLIILRVVRAEACLTFGSVFVVFTNRLYFTTYITSLIQPVLPSAPSPRSLIVIG